MCLRVMACRSAPKASFAAACGMQSLSYAMLHSVCCDTKHPDQYFAPGWGAAAVAAGAAGQPWGWPLSLGQLALMWPQVLALPAQG